MKSCRELLKTFLSRTIERLTIVSYCKEYHEATNDSVSDVYTPVDSTECYGSITQTASLLSCLYKLWLFRLVYYTIR